MPVELLSSSLSTSGIAPESSTPPVVWHYLATLSYAIAKSSSRYMQIWMNLQNQHAMATFSFASPSDNKNPRAGAQSIDRHDQSVEPGSNFSCCYALYERFQEFLRASGWEWLQLQVTIIRECWGEAWFHVLLDVHGNTKLESPTSTPLPPRQTCGMRKLHHAKNVTNWSCLVQVGKFRVQSFWATATKFDHLHFCREALAW